ncbi:VWA domain-containing protein [uncultured Piscinibacter sp.]|uniref:VWA domain-containing protein n=1 Tax=uncultured Piscinibacter sp. TaxID=1131835 RepID=UPI00261D3D18|nr:VWA domain-containing protein [uncultured Piscinibacter sp.]
MRRETVMPALAALLLAAGFLQPTLPWKRSLFEHVVVIDITQSMNVQDQQVDGRPASRLAFAKQALHEALPDLPCGSTLGWAIFTEYRSYLLFTPVEVCANRAELRASLASIDGRMAWSGNSEIAKGLHSGIVVSKALPSRPSLVFVTDGHESPPLNPRHRPRFDDESGEVAGVVVGVGEAKPSPIPKLDPLGRPLGFWGSDEVAQVDLHSLGRGGSVGQETMVEEGSAPAGASLGATPGSEHLSGLREPYLRLLAGENGLAYHRLRSGSALSQVLRDPALARPVGVRGDLRLPLAALAALLLLAPHAAALWSLRRRPGPTRRAAARGG